LRHTKGSIGDDVELGMITFWETCKEEVEDIEHKRKLESPSAPPLSKSAICILLCFFSYYMFLFSIPFSVTGLLMVFVRSIRWRNKMNEPSDPHGS
jgi:hypothetical protein